MKEELSRDYGRLQATFAHAREALRAELVSTFASNRCRCGLSKDRHSTPFCTKCFSSLPRDMRRPWKSLYDNYQYFQTKRQACLDSWKGMSPEELILDSLTDGYVAEYDRCLDLVAARRRGEVIHRRKEELEEIEVPA